MKIMIKILIVVLLTLNPLSRFNGVNLALATDRMAQNDKEADELIDGEGEEEGDDGEEYADDGAQKPAEAPPAEGQATNGKHEAKPEDLAKPANPPTEEGLPKPSDITPPIEPEFAKTPPPAPPREGIKNKKSAKAPKKPAPKAKVTKAKPVKSKPKKEVAKAKAKSKPKLKETAKKTPPKKGAKGKGDKKPAGKIVPNSKTTTVNCNMREKPNQNSKKLGLLNSGQKIKTEPSNARDWFKVTNKGKPAFVNATCFK